MTPQNEASLIDCLSRIAIALESISASLGYRILQEEPDSFVSVCSLLSEIAEHLEGIDERGINVYEQND